MLTYKTQLKISLYTLISRQNSIRIKQYHTNYQEDYGNLLELISLPLITSIILHHSKFLVIKGVQVFSAYNNTIFYVYFAEYGLPSKIALDIGISFISEKVTNFCK